MCSSTKTTSTATGVSSADRSSGSGGGKCFRRIRRLAGEAVAAYDMIAAGDRVLVGLSGGRDSLVLLETLIHLAARAPVDFTVGAITFDPGFPGFNAAGVGAYCRARGILHETIALDIPAILAAHRNTGRTRRPCVLCSRLRRGRLYRFARERGFNKLALGQHLDDVLASFLISLWRGHGLSTMAPRVAADTADGGNPLAIIRPLVFASEEQVKAAAGEFAFPEAGRCLYHDELEASGDRAWAERQIAFWENRIPHVRQNMLRSLRDVRPAWLLDRRFLP